MLEKILALPREVSSRSNFNELIACLGKLAAIGFHSVLEAVPKRFQASVVLCFLAVALLCGPGAKAELIYQNNLASSCKPAAARAIGLTSWKGAACTSKCFVWRLTCSDGRTQLFASDHNPWTTSLQGRFYEYAPWSVVAYFAPIALILIAACIGGMSVLGFICNAGTVPYLSIAAARYYASVKSDPFSQFAVFFEETLFKPYFYFPVLAFFFLSNLPALIRFIQSVLPHPAARVIAPALDAGAPIDIDATIAALTPDFNQCIQPTHSTRYYRRQTEKAFALKKQVEADADLAKAVIRRERIRHQLNEQL